MALQRGFAFEEPSGNPQQEFGMITGQCERGINKRIRLDQRAVEVDAKRWNQGRVGGDIGDGQRGRSPSYEIRAITGQKMRFAATDVGQCSVYRETFKRSYTSLSFILMVLPRVPDSCLTHFPFQLVKTHFLRAR